MVQIAIICWTRQQCFAFGSAGNYKAKRILWRFLNEMSSVKAVKVLMAKPRRIALNIMDFCVGRKKNLLSSKMKDKVDEMEISSAA